MRRLRTPQHQPWTPRRGHRGRDDFEPRDIFGRCRAAAVRGTQARGLDRVIGLDPETCTRDPAHRAQHRFVTGQEYRDSFTDMQRTRRLPANARFGYVADGDVEFSQARAGKRRLDQARLPRLALFVWGR